MKLHIFAVRDRTTDQFGNPMFLIAHGQAIRSFQDEINRAVEDNLLYRHPEDFDLYYLGVFETDAGVFEVKVPQQVAIGKDLVIKK